MEVLFYPGAYTPLAEPTRGTVVRTVGDSYVIAADLGQFTIPISQTREPFEQAFYEFYKAEGYYADLWKFHAPVLAIFFVFIY